MHLSVLSPFLFRHCSWSDSMYFFSNDKNLSDAEFTVELCACNFIMLLSYVWYLNIYICIPFDLQVNAVGSVQVQSSHFWVFISTPCKATIQHLEKKLIYTCQFRPFSWKSFSFFFSFFAQCQKIGTNENYHSNQSAVASACQCF